MKRICLLHCFIICMLAVHAQQTRLPEIDKSPLDMAYFPADYPVLKIQNKISEAPVVRVIYSRPHKSGRTIFGELIEYGKVWRLGANESTEIEFFKDVKLNGKKLARGRYSLFAIPQADKWTIIVNKETDSWGAFKYDENKDVFRTEIPVIKNGDTEAMSMIFEAAGAESKTFNLIIAWDDVKVHLPFSY